MCPGPRIRDKNKESTRFAIRVCLLYWRDWAAPCRPLGRLHDLSCIRGDEVADRTEMWGLVGMTSLTLLFSGQNTKSDPADNRLQGRDIEVEQVVF